MIKAAGVAGAAAWTAPVIIDSLASPAAAATNGPCSAFTFQVHRVTGSCTGPTTHAPCSGFTGIADCRNYTGTAPTPTASTCSGSGNVSVTFTVSGTCRIVGTGTATGNVCPGAPTLTAITPATSHVVTVALNPNSDGLMFVAVNGC
jgi:hypothetical protein